MEEQLEKVARPYSAWGKFFCRKFKDRVTTRGSLTRSPTLAMVGGRCIYDQHHGGGGELFSSEVNSSFMEVGSKEAQCVRRLELKKGLSLAGKSLEQGRVGGNLRVRGQLPVWAEQQRQHTVLDGVLGVSNILFSL